MQCEKNECVAYLIISVICTDRGHLVVDPSRLFDLGPVGSLLGEHRGVVVALHLHSHCGVLVRSTRLRNAKVGGRNQHLQRQGSIVSEDLVLELNQIKSNFIL